MVERIRRIKEEVVGVVSLLGSLYLSLCFFTHNIKDPVLFFRTTEPPEPVRNLGGIIGAYISGWLLILLGLAAFIIPVLIIAFGIKRLLGKEGHKIYLLGGILFVVSSSLLLSLLSFTFTITLEQYPDGIGGLIGKGTAYLAHQLLSLLGAYILSITLFLSSLILLSPVSITTLAFSRKQKTEERKKDIEEILQSVEESEQSAGEMLLKEQVIQEIMVSKPVALKPRKRGGYELPSLELLNLFDSSSVRPSRDELMTGSTLIKQKLEDFDVEGDIKQVHPGPVVTMYEFEPAPGVKINRVVSLADDLALALKAQSVRISPIPGKATIGIEVPNRQRETVSLREILSSDSFKKSTSKLTLGLGKDISGSPVVADLAKMPHLLVAGATGSGKSVSINTMVMSILYKATPTEVKMLMIDPKLLELSAYEEIPHLVSPVITNPKEAAEALKKMVIEMERRYRVLAEKAARNIESYNNQVGEEEQLPYIVIVIDELADLMFTAAADVEDSIARLAQMGRAAGIHLILATQRPSVDVITGIIKANFPARISFQVSSKVDSRTILDSHGAEQLLGKGDMLLMYPGARIIRVHGALIAEEEIKAVTEFVKAQGKPDYTLLENIQQVDEMGADEKSGERDEMYLKAIEFGELSGEVSISSIQRRFKIGYNRAARIMELMEEDGYVGPPRGAGKPREFLRRRR
ncbi:MAG: DNA translocase FtsK 4TM domain-containing protein [Nitrospirota bacterium]|nr:DNA translocase FtsK 4TM domain-containing protein [Nitrospirota bacterium]MDH5767652.1 DNA translocase FtsK 4TM domain-containing protein [Nitrospirota bacterium]